MSSVEVYHTKIVPDADAFEDTDEAREEQEESEQVLALMRAAERRRAAEGKEDLDYSTPSKDSEESGGRTGSTRASKAEKTKAKDAKKVDVLSPQYGLKPKDGIQKPVVDEFETVKKKNDVKHAKKKALLKEAEDLGFKKRGDDDESNVHAAACYMKAYRMSEEEARHNVHAVLNSIFQPMKDRQTGALGPSKAIQSVKTSLEKGYNCTNLIRVPTRAIVQDRTFINYNPGPNDIGTPVEQVLKGFQNKELAERVPSVCREIYRQYIDLYRGLFGPHADIRGIRCIAVYNGKINIGPCFFVNLELGNGQVRHSPTNTPDPKADDEEAKTPERSKAPIVVPAAPKKATKSVVSDAARTALHQDREYQRLLAASCLLKTQKDEDDESADNYASAQIDLKRYERQFYADFK